MTADPVQAAEAVFLAALDKVTPVERAAYVEGACTGNVALLARVRELLASHEQSEGPLDAPPPGYELTVDQPTLSETPGTRIGPYKLLQLIGEGGMGAVWMAEQQEPVRRLVALKVIKAGMDSAQVIARFEAERQALALMDHPNIAKVLDAGTIGSKDEGGRMKDEKKTTSASDSSFILHPSSLGRPYFVMELVKGTPITKYCDEHRLAPKERLELFVPVCQGLQHAHQKGIIHRDVKPSNVLVAPYDGKPVVKVIDFGVAKATGQRLTERTMFTELGAVVGTLEYMSPEQAELNNQDIDTRSDIYSLGVLLYELLTGTTPLSRERLRKAAFTEMLRLIREEEPPKPSKRLSESTETLPVISARRQTEPRKLAKLVRGDLDWIVMKALEKDRGRRYETANGLARDLERYLADEPVEACPPSAVYRLRKFFRKHKAGILTMAGFVLLLLLAGASWLWSAFREADRLQEEAKQLQQRTERLQAIDADLNQAVDLRKRAAWPEARVAVSRAEARLKDGDPPPLWGRVKEARADLELVARLEEIRLEQAGIKHKTPFGLPGGGKVVGGRRTWQLGVQFDLGESDAAYRKAFRQYGLDLESLAPNETARRIRASAIKDQVVAALDNWAHAKKSTRLRDWQRLVNVARLVETDPWHRELQTAILDNDHKRLIEMAKSDKRPPRFPISWLLLANGVYANNELPLAVQVLRRAQLRHPNDFWINILLGSYLLQSRPPPLDEAIAFFRVAVALRPKAEVAYIDLAIALMEKDDAEAAIVVCRRGLEINPDFTALRANLGTALFNKGNYQAALAEFRQVARRQPTFAEIHHNIGNALHELGKHEEALIAYRRAITLNPGLPELHTTLSLALSEQGKLAEAETTARKVINRQPKSAEAHFALGRALGGQGKYAEAETAFRKAIALRPDIEAAAHYNLGIVLSKQGKVREAAAAFRQAIRLDPAHAEAHHNLGHSLATLGKPAEAEVEFRAAIGLKPALAETRVNLGNVLLAQGKAQEAENAFREALRLKPAHVDAHYNLGQVLARAGKASEALEHFQEVMRLQPDIAGPLKEHMQTLDHYLELEKKLPAFAAGKFQPEKMEDWGMFFWICQGNKFYAAAARAARSAFAAAPNAAEDLDSGLRFDATVRYDAACCAALAASGQGRDAKNLTHQRGSRLRKEALAWLRADLASYGRLVKSGKGPDAALVQRRLARWQRDPELSGIRDAAELGRLPAGELEICQKFWAEVDALLAKTRKP
jgi:serine/threonine protein kinase/Flp pilus assembly protein TadD/type II secretory pathway component PulJ